jgi:flavin reductase (DIM6/NTAB) family NADH-FMN oxidoreductase RutF
MGITAPASTLNPGPAAALRRAWGQFPTGVTVLAVKEGDGVRGMTANSFTSVSLEPPLVLVAIDRGARTVRLLRKTGRFAASVLAEHHREWADRFAGRCGDRQREFVDVALQTAPSGLPIVDGALAVFDCRVVAVHPGGDHWLFVAEVEHFTANPGAAPLIYFASAYRSLAPAIRHVATEDLR